MAENRNNKLISVSINIIKNGLLGLNVIEFDWDWNIDYNLK